MHRTHAGHGSIWPSEAVEARASDQSTLTPERIAELRALLAKATPGPWAVGKHKSDVGVAGEDFGAGYPARAGTVASLYDGEYIKNPRSVQLRGTRNEHQRHAILDALHYPRRWRIYVGSVSPR